VCLKVFLLSAENKLDLVYVESQNQIIVEIGRNLQRSYGPTTLLMQGHLEMIVQHHV